MASKASPLKQFGHAARRILANFWLNTLHSSKMQIGVTGSYGKTSTTYITNALLSAYGPTIVTDVNLDTIYNVPITALRVRSKHEFVLFELGIDTLNEMSFHLQIAHPSIGVMTGIAPVHTDEEHLGSLENIIREKRKLIEFLKPGDVAILNHDDERVREMASHTQADVLWYGTDPTCDYRAEDIRVSTDGLMFRAVTPDGAIEIKTALLGRHNAVNAMAAIAVAKQAGVPDETIETVFTKLVPLKGRLNIEEGPLGITLINDSLRANTSSTRAGLEFVRDLDSGDQKLAVLGEMGEIGETAEQEHYQIGQFAADCGLDLLICVGGLTEQIAQGAVDAGMPKDKVQFVSNVAEAADFIRQDAQPGTLLYLKGSLLKHLERIVLILGGEDVGCTVTSCPFYYSCRECQHLVTGYQNVVDNH